VQNFCFALEEHLSLYRSAILAVESDFLNERAFTTTSLQVTLLRFFETLPDLFKTVSSSPSYGITDQVQRIELKRLRGG